MQIKNCHQMMLMNGVYSSRPARNHFKLSSFHNCLFTYKYFLWSCFNEIICAVTDIKKVFWGWHNIKRYVALVRHDLTSESGPSCCVYKLHFSKCVLCVLYLIGYVSWAFWSVWQQTTYASASRLHRTTAIYSDSASELAFLDYQSTLNRHTVSSGFNAPWL